MDEGIIHVLVTSVSGGDSYALLRVDSGVVAPLVTSGTDLPNDPSAGKPHSFPRMLAAKGDSYAFDTSVKGMEGSMDIGDDCTNPARPDPRERVGLAGFFPGGGEVSNRVVAFFRSIPFFPVGAPSFSFGFGFGLERDMLNLITAAMSSLPRVEEWLPSSRN